MDELLGRGLRPQARRAARLDRQRGAPDGGDRQPPCARRPRHRRDPAPDGGARRRARRDAEPPRHAGQSLLHPGDADRHAEGAAAPAGRVPAGPARRRPWRHRLGPDAEGPDPGPSVTQLRFCQWSREESPLTGEICEVLYDESQGIIDVVIKLYVLAQFRLISFASFRPGPERIDAELLRWTAPRPRGRRSDAGGKIVDSLIALGVDAAQARLAVRNAQAEKPGASIPELQSMFLSNAAAEGASPPAPIKHRRESRRAETRERLEAIRRMRRDPCGASGGGPGQAARKRSSRDRPSSRALPASCGLSLAKIIGTNNRGFYSRPGGWPDQAVLPGAAAPPRAGGGRHAGDPRSPDAPPEQRPDRQSAGSSLRRHARPPEPAPPSNPRLEKAQKLIPRAIPPSR